MQKLPFRYEDWITKTSGGVFASRSARLKALDEAIRKYDRAASVQSATVGLKNDILEALKAYLAEEEARSGVEAWKRSPRNKDRIIEDLVNAVSGPANESLELVQNFADWPVPTVVEPQVDIPAPPRQPSNVDPLLEKRAEKWTVTAAEVQVAVPTRGSNQLDVNTLLLLRKIDALYSDLSTLKSDVNSKLLLALVNFNESVKKGFNDFKELHRLDAEDVVFKISLIQYAFEALSNLPFPLSTVGAVGKGIVGLATTDTHWSSLTVDLPTPGGFKGKIAAKVAQFNDFRNQNVSPSNLEQQEQLVFRFFKFFNELSAKVNDAFESEIKDIDNEQKRRALTEKRMSAIGGQADLALVTAANTEIDDLGNSIRRQFEPLKALAPVNHEDVAIWITVSLIADYAISGLCKGRDVKTMKAAELGKIGFGDKFAKFLGSPQVGIVQIKNESGESSGIYGGGKIPWNGSANHVVGVMLYLDWFKRTLNPFDLLRQEVRTGHFRNWSAEYIRNLGQAMAAHKATAFEKVADIQQAVTSAQNRGIVTGGNIGDAFADFEVNW